MTPYWEDSLTRLYLGDMRDIIPALGLRPNLIIADPPYGGETSLLWDIWPDGWLETAAAASRSMWCFGSSRMFLERSSEFTHAGWKFSQDVIWEKQNGSGFAADRFKRVHELIYHWYRGAWGTICHEVPRVPQTSTGDKSVVLRPGPPHTGKIGSAGYTDDGTRLARSVLRVPNMHRHAIHRTEKPAGILSPLIHYGCPDGGLVLDPFAGSCSTLEAARELGFRAIGIERHEPFAEDAALRLSGMPVKEIRTRRKRLEGLLEDDKAR